MGVNSFLYLKKANSRFENDESNHDFMNCRDISWLEQVIPFIKEFSNEDEVILEPFCGMGTTVIGAGLLGRKSIGIELENERFNLLRQHVALYSDKMKYCPRLICGDTLNVEYPDNVDLVVTNYPYFNGTITKTSTNNFYSVNEYSKYLLFIESVIKKCERSLKRGGYMVSFCENIRDLNGNMIPQAYDICKILEKYFYLKDERIVLYEKDGYLEEDYTRTNRAHEYVFICKKKDKEKDIAGHLSIAEELSNKCECILMGSMALHLEYPMILDSFPEDVDLFADSKIENLRKIISVLMERGFEVFSWQDKIDANVSYELLKGRYYLRGINEKDNNKIIVDITYEKENFCYQEVKASIVKINGIKVFNKEVLVKLLKDSAKKKNRAQAQRLIMLKNVDK